MLAVWVCVGCVAAMAGEGPITTFKTITQEAAEAVTKAAKEEAAKLESPIYKPAKTKMHIHVLGHEGTLMAATQTNGAWPELEAKGPLFGIEHSNGGLITLPGGIPLKDADGALVGAIGVSGDTVDM